jgi:aquaporin Z
MRRYVVEALGTFFLVFTVICAVGTRSTLSPLGVGAVLMVMTYAGAHISGAHFNPAVSLAAWVRGRLDTSDLAPYIGAQLVGALAASLLGLWMFQSTRNAAWSGKDLAIALVVELLFTFALAYVYLNVLTSKDHVGNSFFGLAIGFTVAAGAVAAGALSGAAFNPGVALGVSVAGMSAWRNIWVYVLAQVLGGAAAGYLFNYLEPEVTAPSWPSHRAP